MDDFVMINLMESKNEWCHRLVSLLTPLVIEGIRSIFNEAWNLCLAKNETNKYLMTFQNLLSCIPKWNSLIVEEERKRIIERSGCNYLEDLITCVHIIQVKVLTSIRVGNKQKKIDISIPKLDHFLHKVYQHAARKVYTNVYLFEKNLDPLRMQKYHRELELIVQEVIMVTIRESVPTEAIIRAYMDESIEEEEIISIEPVPQQQQEEQQQQEQQQQRQQSSGENNNYGNGSEEGGGGGGESPDIIPVPSVRDFDGETDQVVKTKTLTFAESNEMLLGNNTTRKVEAFSGEPFQRADMLDNNTIVLPSSSFGASANSSGVGKNKRFLDEDDEDAPLFTQILNESVSLDDMVEELL